MKQYPKCSLRAVVDITYAQYWGPLERAISEHWNRENTGSLKDGAKGPQLERAGPNGKNPGRTTVAHIAAFGRSILEGANVGLGGSNFRLLCIWTCRPTRSVHRSPVVLQVPLDLRGSAHAQLATLRKSQIVAQPIVRLRVLSSLTVAL